MNEMLRSCTEQVSNNAHNFNICTTLIKEIGKHGTSGSPTLVDMEVIEVESTEQLQVGDYIRIGEEATQIQGIDGNKITLTEALKEHHEVRTSVSQIQKVEFLLFKLRELEKDTSLSLLLGKKEVIAEVTNYGNEEARYNIETELTRGNGQKLRSIVEGPVHGSYCFD